MANTPYCQLSDVKMLLDTQSTKSDAWITSLIPQAQALIDQEVGYSFQSEGTVDTPVTKRFSGADQPQLITGWISEITQAIEVSYALVTGVDGNPDILNAGTRDITADVVIGPENKTPGFFLERLSLEPFNFGKRNYIVKGVWGWPTIPADITRACARLTGHLVKMRDTNYADTLVEQGTVKQKYTKQIPDDVKEILCNYRLRSFYAR